MPQGKLSLERVDQLIVGVGHKYANYLMANQDKVPSAPVLALCFIVWVCDWEPRPYEINSAPDEGIFFSGMAALNSVFIAFGFEEEKICSLRNDWMPFIKNYAATKDAKNIRDLYMPLLAELKLLNTKWA